MSGFVLEGKTLEILLHGADNPLNADIHCEHAEWKGYDLTHCPGIGEWKCALQGSPQAGDQYGVDHFDYISCAVADHNRCEIYKKHHEDCGTAVNTKTVLGPH